MDNQRITKADLLAMLESVNNQLDLNGTKLGLGFTTTTSRKVTLYRLVMATHREISFPCEIEEAYNILTSLQRVLQQIGL